MAGRQLISIKRDNQLFSFNEKTQVFTLVNHL
jgi:hypothetical protein